MHIQAQRSRSSQAPRSRGDMSEEVRYPLDDPQLAKDLKESGRLKDISRVTTRGPIPYSGGKYMMISHGRHGAHHTAIAWLIRFLENPMQAKKDLAAAVEATLQVIELSVQKSGHPNIQA